MKKTDRINQGNRSLLNLANNRPPLNKMVDNFDKVWLFVNLSFVDYLNNTQHSLTKDIKGKLCAT